MKEKSDGDTDQYTSDPTQADNSCASDDESYVELLSIKEQVGRKRPKRELLDVDFEPTNEIWEAEKDVPIRP
jgi:hypothetical protein